MFALVVEEDRPDQSGNVVNRQEDTQPVAHPRRRANAHIRIRR